MEADDERPFPPWIVILGNIEGIIRPAARPLVVHHPDWNVHIRCRGFNRSRVRLRLWQQPKIPQHRQMGPDVVQQIQTAAKRTAAVQRSNREILLTGIQERRGGIAAVPDGGEEGVVKPSEGLGRAEPGQLGGNSREQVRSSLSKSALKLAQPLDGACFPAYSPGFPGTARALLPQWRPPWCIVRCA